MASARASSSRLRWPVDSARAWAWARFRGGWFHSGDLAVQHPDGYIEIRDRL